MNVGVIGAGGIAYKLHLPQMEQVPEIQVTHLAGRKEHRLSILAEKFGVPHWTTDYRELLAEESIDGIVVALPHPLHVPIGLEVLAAGKHLLMQKPLCGSLQEANQFVEAVERTDRTVLALPHFSSDIKKARQMVQEGAIGKLTGAHCRVSHGGPEVYYAEIRDNFGETEGDSLWFFRSDEAAVGALFDMGVYAVSVLVAVLGTVESVIGVTATLDKPTALEDTAILILQFANGAMGTAETSWCDPSRTWQFRVHGTRGKLSMPGHEGASFTFWEPGSYTREDIPPTPHTIDSSYLLIGNAHAHWFQCIQEGRHPELSNAWTARHVTEVLLAGLESARTGQRVSIHSTAEQPARGT